MASANRIDEPSTRRGEVEEAVLRATGSLLAEGEPFGRLGVERIAKRAGISRTAFYFYFRDKRELLMRLSDDVAPLFYAQAEGWWTGRGDGAAELTAALHELRGLYREHGPLLRAIVEASTSDAEVAAFWRGVVGRFAEATRRRIEAEQATGRAAGVPAAATAFALAWMTERAFYECLVDPAAVRDDELIAALSSIWLRAVHGTPGGTESVWLT